MRSLWAVACAASVPGLLLLLAGGCAGTKSQVKEFNRMEVGEGPREMLSQMIEMQKEPGGQRVEAHPVLVSPGQSSVNPAFSPSDYPAGNLSMSRATGAMHDIQPAVPPLGNSPLLVKTDVQNAESSPGDPVPPASDAPGYSPSNAPSRKAPPPVIAPAKSPPPAPPEKTPAPATASVAPPAPILPKKEPPPADTTVHLPLPAKPKKTPAPAIASAKPPVSPGSIPPPPPPPANYPTVKKEEKSPEIKISRATPPPAVTEKKKTEADDFSGGPNYRIGPEDILHVDVWGNEELTRDVTVRPDGKISLPLIQDIQAEGLTAAELSGVIQQKLLAYVKGPEVAVIVTQINAPKVFVIGYVTRPGPYPLRGDMSVLQVLSLAGGFTPFASPKSIKVIRNNAGKREVRKVNYYDMIGKGGEGNVFLKPGDTIVVP